MNEENWNMPVNNPRSSMKIGELSVDIVGAINAPIITFDVAPTYQAPHGNVGVTLVAFIASPTETSTPITEGRVTAILRTSREGAMSLIDSLQKALLTLAPAPNSDGPKN